MVGLFGRLWIALRYACSFPESLRMERNTEDGEILVLDKIEPLKLNKRAIDRLELAQAVEAA